MLILTRRLNEVIVIGDNIRIRVASIGRWGEVRLAIDAPPAISVHREEIFNKVGAKPLKPKPTVDEEIADLMKERP